MEKAEVADFLQAIRQDMLKKPAEKRHAVEVGSAEAGTTDFPVGEGDRAVREADETVVGDGDFEDRGGKGGDGGVAVVSGLTMDIPGDGPDLRVDLLQQASVAHVVFEEGTGDGGQGFDGNKEVGAGGPPGHAVRCEAPTGHTVMDVRVVLELPTPGVQDTGEPRQVGPNETRVSGEPFEGERRGGEQGIVCEALV
jgi:hypothetical protein